MDSGATGPPDVLLSSQRQAVDHVAGRSTGPALDPSLRVTLNFHPDRAVGQGVVLDEMARDGVYRSQFETGTSSGGLTAHPGGDRWEWERRMFGGAYDDAPASARPKYGALNFRGRPVGGSPRFGSSHLRLRAGVSWRSTFCYPDSVFDPVDFGVSSACGLIDLALEFEGDPLDDYIEAHVHGPLRLATDVEAVVLDPSFAGTAVEAAARRLPCSVEWHNGFRLHVDELVRHPDYRGPEYVALGQELAVDGWLDPALIGAASRVGRHDEAALKRLWHYLACFGYHR
ncbi:DUF3626 domain-containing protein [soil metagenome]